MQVSVKGFRDNMAEPVNRAAYGGERIILTRRGEGVAAIVSMEDLALLEEFENAADLKAAIKARKEHGAVPWERVKVKLAARRAAVEDMKRDMKG